ncbi:MAG: type III pantothenate kinase, partial [Kiloniellales bacterium]|nr:type III pantothenate kinase [Kiloniellales bacterium]
ASLCSHYFGTDPLIVGRQGVESGLRIEIDRPETLGADRIANAIAAHNRYRGPLIVVDFGTATNFDVVDESGAFIGGVLAPGVDLSLDALSTAAAKLPRIRVRMPERVIGRTTESALESGFFWGHVGLVEGLISRIRSEFGKPMKVVGTGGLAPLFERASPLIDVIDPELTLRGLLDIYRLNVNR